MRVSAADRRCGFVRLGFVLIAVLAAASGARAQSASDCLSDIERWMREYEARYAAAAALINESDPQNAIPPHVNWPGCCENTNAPNYPPDGYYQDALSSNPELGPSLVDALRTALLGNTAVNNMFVSDADPSTWTGTTPPTFVPSFPNEGNPVNMDNECGQLQRMRVQISRMTQMIIPSDFLHTPLYNPSLLVCGGWHGQACNTNPMGSLGATAQQAFSNAMDDALCEGQQTWPTGFTPPTTMGPGIYYHACISCDGLRTDSQTSTIACCFSSGCQSQIDSGSCLAQGGQLCQSSQSNYPPCSSGNDPSVACCNTTPGIATCSIMPQSQCLASGWLIQPGGGCDQTACDNTQSAGCCFGAGGCQPLGPNACRLQGGVRNGCTPGPGCTISLTTVACCSTTPGMPACSIMTLAECSSLNWISLGTSTTCSADLQTACDNTQAAGCCVGGLCQTWGPNACRAQLGKLNGCTAGQPCGPPPCSATVKFYQYSKRYNINIPRFGIKNITAYAKLVQQTEGFGEPGQTVPGILAQPSACDSDLQTGWIAMASANQLGSADTRLRYNFTLGPDGSNYSNQMVQFQPGANGGAGGFIDCTGANKTCVDRGWSLGNWAVVATPDFDTDPDSDQPCGEGCTSCGPGVKSEQGSVKVHIPLGVDNTGRSNSIIQLRGKDIVPDLASLSAQTYKLGPGFTIAQDPNTPAGGEPSWVQITGPQLSGLQVVALGTTLAPLQAVDNGDGTTSYIGIDAANTHRVQWSFYYVPPGSLGAPGPSNIANLNVSPSSVTTIQYQEKDLPDLATYAATLASQYQNQAFTPNTVAYAPGTNYGRVLQIATTGMGHGQWQYRQVGQAWDLEKGLDANWQNPVTIEQKLTTWTDSAHKFIVKTLSDNAGHIASRNTETRQEFTWGEAVVERRTGLVGSEQVETRTYVDTPSITDPATSFDSNPACGKIASLQSPTGLTTTWTYDTVNGRQASVQRQYTAGGVTHSEGSSFQTITVPASDGSVMRAIHERVDWVGSPSSSVARSYDVGWYSAPGTLVPAGQLVRWHVNCATPNLTTTPDAFLTGLVGSEIGATGSPAPLVNVSVQQSGFPYRAISRRHPDGTLTTYGYTDNSDGSRITNVYTGPSSSPAASEVLGGSNTVAGGTETITTKNVYGLLMSSQVYDLQSSNGPVLLTTTTASPDSSDPLGRPGSICTSTSSVAAASQSSGSSGTSGSGGGSQCTLTSYGCCGLSSRTDADGIQTQYVYDALHRLIQTWRQVDLSGSGTPMWVGTLQSYDAAGRVTQTNTTAASANPVADSTVAQFLESATSYDASGQVTSTTDASGLTTLYAQQASSGYIVHTQTPSVDSNTPADQYTQTFNPDGTMQSTNQTSGRLVTYQTGVETVSGWSYPLRYTLVTRGSSGMDWTKTYINALGQTGFVTTSGGAVQGSLCNNAGQPEMSVDPDGVISLHYSGYGLVDAATKIPLQSSSVLPMEVDWSGQWTLDVTSSGAQASNNVVVNFGGSDRIKLTTIGIASNNGVNVRRTQTWDWGTIGSSTPTLLTSTDTTIDGLSTWTSKFGLTSSTTRSSTGVPGQVVIVECAPGDACRTTLMSYGLTYQVTVTAPDGTQLSQVNTTYDSTGHEWKVDSTLGSQPTTETTTTYYPSGQVWTQTRSVLNSTLIPSQVTTYTYDALGRASTIDYGGGTSTASYSYWPSGDQRHVEGFGQTTVDYAYDDHGRMVSMTTYQTPTAPATTNWNYDPASGFLMSKTYADRKGPSYAYTAAGRMLSRTWARTPTVTTNYVYNDAFGDLTLTSYTDGTPWVTMSYDRRGHLATVSDAAGLRTLGYDDPGHLVLESFATNPSTGNGILTGVAVGNSYTAAGLRQVHRVYSSNVSGTNQYIAVGYGYDTLNRLNAVVTPDLLVGYTYDTGTGLVGGSNYTFMSTPVDPAAYAASLYNNGSSSTVTNYTSAGTPLAAGQYQYDPFGRLGSVSWADATSAALLARSAYVYDGFNRRTQQSLADQTTWTYGYDAQSQLTSADRSYLDNTQTPAVTYAVPGEHFGFTYDGVGNRTSQSLGGSPLGPPTGTYSLSYTPNSLNQYSQRDTPSIVEVLGRGQFSNSAVWIAGVVSNPVWRGGPDGKMFWGEPSFSNGASGVASTVSITEVPGNTWSYNVFLPQNPEIFSYDDDGNLTGDGLWTYKWDAENRLIQVELQTAAQTALQKNVLLTFGYDYLGRRIQKDYTLTTYSSGGSGTGTGTGGGTSQTLAVGGSGKLSHPIGISPGPTTNVSMTSWRYVWDGWLLSASYLVPWTTPNQWVPDQSFAWGPDLSGKYGGAGGIGGLAAYHDYSSAWLASNNGLPMFPTFDGNGNVAGVYAPSQLSGASVQQVAAYEYGPFGETRSIEGSQGQRNPFRFSTKFTDAESALLFYGARYYAPSAGNWLSRDPINEPGSVNLYKAFSNGPIDTVDFLGLYGYRLTNDPIPDPIREPEHEHTYAVDKPTTLDRRIKLALLGKVMPYLMTAYGFGDLIPEPANRAVQHYLDNTGTPFDINVVRMLNLASFREIMAGEAVAAHDALSPAFGSVGSRVMGRWEVGEIKASESIGWWGFLRGYAYITEAEEGDPVESSCGNAMKFTVTVFKEYNFDRNEGSFSPYLPNAKQMDDLHRAGIARNFEATGAATITISTNTNDISANTDTGIVSHVNDVSQWRDDISLVKTRIPN